MRPGRSNGALALASFTLVACRAFEREHGAVASTEVAEPSSDAGGEARSSSIEAPPTPEETPPSADQAPPWYRGSLDTRFVARKTGGDHDLDLYQVLSLDLGRERVDEWSAHLVARAAWDADGRSSEFPSLADAEGHALDGQVYSAYARRQGLGALEQVTLGRHFLYDTPVVLWLDGVSAESTPRGEKRWTTGAFAGIPVHAFESSSSGDLVLGLYQEVHPSARTRLRADWTHLEDERSGFDEAEDLLGFSAQHDLGERLRLEGKYTRLEGDDRDLSLSASWIDYAKGLTVQVSWYRLLETQAAHVLELDPFFGTLLTLHPYDQARLVVTKDLSRSVHLQGGADLRQVVDESDVGPFNHDFERYFATTTFDRLLPDEVVLALTGELWDGEAAEFATWGADLSRKWTKLSASLGSAYALFDYDPFAGSERERVRTYYASLKYKWKAAASFSLRYELDHGDSDDFQTLRWGASWRF